MPRKAICTFLFFLLAAAISAGAASVKTTDGKTYDGSVKFEAGKFVVTSSAGNILRLNPADVAEAAFDVRSAAPPTADSGQGLLGQYFADNSFTRLAFTRVDPIVSFEWTRASPHPLVPWGFTGRWTGQILPAWSEDYTFTIATSNPVRLFVDGKPVIDNWTKSKPGEVSGLATLKAGKKTDVRLEFLRSGAEAELKLSWASQSLPREIIPTECLYPTDLPVTGLLAEYFSDTEFTKLAATKIEPNINFKWPSEDHGPDPRVGRPFSARWTGRLIAEKTGNCFLVTRSVDPIKIYLEGKLVLDTTPPTVNPKNGKAQPVRAHADRSEPLPLQAGHTYAIRVETAVADKQPGAAMLAWSFADPGNAIPIPSNALLPPPEHTNMGPAVSIISPPEDAPLNAGKPVTIEARIDPRGAAVTRVEFFDGRRELGVATTRPFQMQWPSPPAGENIVTVVALDSTGMSGTGSARVLVSADASGGLPAPWVQAQVGYQKDKSTISCTGGVYTIEASKGDIWNGGDAMHMACTPLRDEGQVVVRVASLKPSAAGAYAVAGLALRNSLRPDTYSMMAVVTTDPAASVGMRLNETGAPAFTPKTASTPCWLRLTRRGVVVDADYSPDGARWIPLASQSMPIGPIVYVGFFAATRDDGATCTATFDHVTFHTGPPPMLYSTKGILLKDGTFFPGEVRIADDTTLHFIREGTAIPVAQQEVAYPIGSIARVIYRPMPHELADTLPMGKTGVLLVSGDFLEADVQSLDKYHVKTNSVVFGLGNYSTGNEAAAVLLNDVAPAAACEIRLSDGSILHCDNFTIDKDHLQADTGSGGRIDVTTGVISSIKRGA